MHPYKGMGDVLILLTQVTWFYQPIRAYYVLSSGESMLYFFIRYAKRATHERLSASRVFYLFGDMPLPRASDKLSVNFITAHI